MDFSADVLVKVLKQIPQVNTWKIEGRKKSPHYVYYTVKAYQLLRDDPKQKKEALSLLEYAMGREFSHYNLLPQRPQNPLDHDSQTESGLFLGRVKNIHEPYFITREALFPGDLLRIGNEENKFHDIQKVTRAIPKKGKFYLAKSARFKVKKGTAVHIIDRRGKEIEDQIQELDAQLEAITKIKVKPSSLHPPRPMMGLRKAKKSPIEICIRRSKSKSNKGPRPHGDSGFWISTQRYGIKASRQDWLWLDPVLFPQEATLCRQYIMQAIQRGAKNFVLNAPWQISLFRNPKQLNLWAGPYCNLSNTVAINEFKKMGFSGAIVSPELDKDTFLDLPKSSPLPLGIIIHGNWPLAVSRTLSPNLAPKVPFTSPKGEVAWANKHNDTYYVFPNWVLDIQAHREELYKAGYSHFFSLEENIPKTVKIKPRPGIWNWNLKLL